MKASTQNLPYLVSRLGIFLLGLGLMSCTTTKSVPNPPATASAVDLKRYTGQWKEVARFPTPFQKRGEAALAEYGSNPDGSVSVRNIAIRPDGTERDIRGTAQVLNPPANTKLAVRFDRWFGPLIPVPKDGNYWILYVDEDYQEALVGTSDRKYLWLLARENPIAEARYKALISRAEALGYDISRIERSPAIESASSR